MRKFLKLFCSSFIVFLVLSVSISATPLLPNTTLKNPDPLGGLTAPYYTSGSLLGVHAASGYAMIATMTVPYTELVGNEGITGSVTSNVYVDLFGTLAFEYMFTSTSSSPTADIVRATISDPSNPWAGVAILDAGADGTGASTATGTSPPNWTDGDPNFLLRDPAGQEGLTIQWRALSLGTVLRGDTDGIGPDIDDFSSNIWYVTDAKNYSITSVGLLDSGAVSGSKAFAPGVVPEPATMFLLGSGFFGLIGFKRK